MTKSKSKPKIAPHEAWLYKNPVALAAVMKGLEEAKAGKFVKAKEDFSKYLPKPYKKSKQ